LLSCTPVPVEMRGTADYEPSRERAHETDKGQKHAEFFLHVFQLLVESSLLVLQQALALLGVHPRPILEMYVSVIKLP